MMVGVQTSRGLWFGDWRRTMASLSRANWPDGAKVAASVFLDSVMPFQFCVDRTEHGRQVPPVGLRRAPVHRHVLTPRVTPISQRLQSPRQTLRASMQIGNAVVEWIAIGKRRPAVRLVGSR